MVYSAIYINSYWCRVPTNKVLHISIETNKENKGNKENKAYKNYNIYDVRGKIKTDFGL
jgi:hypothetical protein